MNATTAVILGVVVLCAFFGFVLVIAFLRIGSAAQRPDDDALRDAGYTDEDIERMHREWNAAYRNPE